MGCDIHVKLFFWSKLTNSYITPYEICEYGISDSFQLETMTDRYYDFFGLFGNTTRSNYPELSRLNHGIPEGLSANFKALADYGMKNYCWYGWTWITMTDLRKSLKEYIEKLKNPALFFIPDSEEWQDIKEGIFKIEEWKSNQTSLISYLTGILQSLNELVSGKYDDDTDYQFTNSICDIEKSIFVIWFDN